VGKATAHMSVAGVYRPWLDHVMGKKCQFQTRALQQRFQATPAPYLLAM